MIDPNPDTPLVNAYSYNFGKRVRQPGGRRLRNCLPAKGTQGKPACECYVFNNWGRPETLRLDFAGFDDCSTSCASLNNSCGMGGPCGGQPGQGPFVLTFDVEVDEYFDETTGLWVGGGLGVVFGWDGATGAPKASGLGYSCTWSANLASPTDACEGSAGVKVTCQIGWDTTAGVFCQVLVFGESSAVLYYAWTWTQLPVTPGQLDCSGNAPEAYRLDHLLGGFDQASAGWANAVQNLSAANPNTFWFELNEHTAAAAGCETYIDIAGGTGKNYAYLCQGCCEGIGACTQPNASASVSCCCWSNEEQKCLCGGGTNEVAPPCCCGSATHPPGGYFIACVNCEGTNCMLVLQNNGDGTWSSHYPTCGLSTATLKIEGGSWTLEWSGTCSGSYTFSGDEVQLDPLCLQSADGKININCNEGCISVCGCNFPKGRVPTAFDVEASFSLVLGSEGDLGNGFGAYVGCCYELRVTLELDSTGNYSFVENPAHLCDGFTDLFLSVSFDPSACLLNIQFGNYVYNYCPASGTEPNCDGSPISFAFCDRVFNDPSPCGGHDSQGNPFECYCNQPAGYPPTITMGPTFL